MELEGLGKVRKTGAIRKDMDIRSPLDAVVVPSFPLKTGLRRRIHDTFSLFELEGFGK